MEHALPTSWRVESDLGPVTVELNFADRTVTFHDPVNIDEEWYYPFAVVRALSAALRQARDTLIRRGEMN